MEIIDQLNEIIGNEGIKIKISNTKEVGLKTLEFKSKLKDGTLQTTVLDIKKNKILAIYGSPYEWGFMTEVDGLSSEDLLQLVRDLLQGRYEIKKSILSRRSNVIWRGYRAKNKRKIIGY